MSANLLEAFKFVINLQGREVALERGIDTFTVKMAPSNYFRNFAGVEEVNIEGREFVVAKSELDSESFPIPPKRGDIIFDSSLGSEDTVDEVKPLFILGELAGYRIRTA